MQKTLLKNSILLCIMIVTLFGFGALSQVYGVNIPLHSGPFVDGNNDGIYQNTESTGQNKLGNLTIGSGTAYTGSPKLGVTGQLKITKTPCDGITPCSRFVSAPELHVLQNSYMKNAVIGWTGTGNPTPWTDSSMDIRGYIQGDPSATYMNYPAGSYYNDGTTTSSTDKMICADPSGNLIICP